jgi:hypothetical protein
MQKTGLLLSFAIFIVHVPLVFAEPVTVKSCHVVARVIESNDPRYRPGDGICLGDNTLFTGQVVLACSKSAGSAFAASSAAEAIKCENLPRGRAAGGRGGDGKPFLLGPVGTTLSKSITTLRWQKVEGASSYRITLIGIQNYTQWQGSTAKLYINIPNLNLESTTQVLIEALFQKRILSQSLKIFNFINTSDLQALNSDIRLISKLEVSESEKIYLIASLYQRYGLLEDAINFVRSNTSLNLSDRLRNNLVQELTRKAEVD